MLSLTELMCYFCCAIKVIGAINLIIPGFVFAELGVDGVSGGEN